MKEKWRKKGKKLSDKLFGNPIMDSINRKSREKAENSNDLLEEFSEDENDFYVDEVKRTNSRKKEQNNQKKAKQKRKPMTPTKRRIKKYLGYGAIITVILIVCVVLSLTVLFKTQVFEVTGNTRYDNDEIIATSGLVKGENIFISPKSLAAWRIKSTYPYVEDVDIGIRIPDTITIDIKEATESYLVKISDTEYLIISSQGRILNTADSPEGIDLPIFIGPEALTKEVGEYIEYEDDGILEIINAISTVFVDNGYQGITEINASEPANLTFTYQNRILVKLGLPEDIDYKIRTAMTIIQEKIDVNEDSEISGTLDVSKCNVTKKSYFSENVTTSQENIDIYEFVDEYGNPILEPTETISETVSSNLSWDNLLETEPSTDENGDMVEQPEETKPKISQDDWYVN